MDTSSVAVTPQQTTPIVQQQTVDVQGKKVAAEEIQQDHTTNEAQEVLQENGSVNGNVQHEIENQVNNFDSAGEKSQVEGEIQKVDTYVSADQGIVEEKMQEETIEGNSPTVQQIESESQPVQNQEKSVVSNTSAEQVVSFESKSTAEEKLPEVGLDQSKLEVDLDQSKPTLSSDQSKPTLSSDQSKEEEKKEEEEEEEEAKASATIEKEILSMEREEEKKEEEEAAKPPSTFEKEISSMEREEEKQEEEVKAPSTVEQEILSMEREEEEKEEEASSSTVEFVLEQGDLDPFQSEFTVIEVGKAEIVKKIQHTQKSEEKENAPNDPAYLSLDFFLLAFSICGIAAAVAFVVHKK